MFYQARILPIVLSIKKDNEPEILFSLKGFKEKIPDIITRNSLTAQGFLSQHFETIAESNKEGKNMVEFSKPIFTKGIISSVVRLGFLLPQNSIIGLKNLTMAAQITGVVLLALLALYYWMIISIRPLEKLCFEQGQMAEIKQVPATTLPGVFSYIQTTLKAMKQTDWPPLLTVP